MGSAVLDGADVGIDEVASGSAGHTVFVDDWESIPGEILKGGSGIDKAWAKAGEGKAPTNPIQAASKRIRETVLIDGNVDCNVGIYNVEI